MDLDQNILRSDEQTIFRLRGLYENYGYRRFKMSKFEAYDLYVRNKDFLVSDRMITFTDARGVLMALKPDVTLSIIKNTRENEPGPRKVYYNETVYRSGKGDEGFQEIMQTGLECIGELDLYHIYEVTALAVRSLAAISPDYVLDVSHVGLVSSWRPPGWPRRTTRRSWPPSARRIWRRWTASVRAGISAGPSAPCWSAW